MKPGGSFSFSSFLKLWMDSSLKFFHTHGWMLPVCSFVTYRKTIEPDANLNPNNGKTEPIHLKIRVRWGMVGVGSEGELGTLNPLQFSSWEGRWLNPPSQQLGLNVRFYLYSQLKIHILFIWAKTVDAQCCQTCKRFILFLNYQTIQMGWESVKWEVKRPSLTRELDWCPKNLLYNICKVLWQKH